MRPFKTAALLIVLALAGAAVPRALAAETTAEQVVETFHQELLATMRDAKTLGFKGRFNRLAPHIERAFHLPLMIQMASGSYWEDTPAPQRQKLIAAFTHLSTSTYASRFDGYSGQSFTTLGRRNGPQKTILVRTKIVNPDGKDVELGYLTRNIKGSWRIIDVLLDGRFSELASRISQYQGILKADGVNGLIATLARKAEKLAATP